MWQSLAFWPQLGPAGRAITLFCLGLAIGSFLSVLLHRLPQRLNAIRGRSRCPNCEHELGPIELIPVLSFLIQRGRCRHCRAPISIRYPLLELGAGLAGALGALHSWSLGLLILVGLAGLATGRSRRRYAAGGLILEILAGAFLLGAVIVPMLDLSTLIRAGATYPRQLAASLASAKLEEWQNKSYRRTAESFCGLDGDTESPDYWPDNDTDVISVGGYSFTRTVTVTAFNPATNDWSDEATHLRQATITVTCPACRSTMTPVVLTLWIGKLEMDPVDPSGWCPHLGY